MESVSAILRVYGGVHNLFETKKSSWVWCCGESRSMEQEFALGPILQVAEKSGLKIRSDKESIESITSYPMTMGSQVLRGNACDALKDSVHMVSEMGQKVPASKEEVFADQTKYWEVKNRKSETMGFKRIWEECLGDRLFSTYDEVLFGI